MTVSFGVGGDPRLQMGMNGLWAQGMRRNVYGADRNPRVSDQSGPGASYYGGIGTVWGRLLRQANDALLAMTPKVGWSTMIHHSKNRPEAVRFYNKYR